MSTNPLVEKFVSLVEKANEIANRFRAETGSQDEKVEAYLNSTDDENIVKNRQWIAEQREKIAAVEAAISERENLLREAALAAVSENSDFDADAAADEFLSLRKEINAMQKGFEAFGMEVPEVEQIVSLKQRTTRARGNGPGTGVSRSSFSAITVEGEPLEKPTFSVAAQVISKRYGKVTAGDLRQSLANAHGDVSEKIGETFTFSHTVTAKDGEQRTLTLTATPTENVRGGKKSEDTDSE